MPASTIELALPRPALWGILAINVILAMFATVSTVALLLDRGRWGMAGAGIAALVAALWWSVCVAFLFLSLHRPHRRPDPSSTPPTPAPPGVELRASRRVPVSAAVSALMAAALFTAGAFVASGGWVIVWAICAATALLAAAVVAVGLRVPGRLVLTEQGVRSSTLHQDAQAAWEDISGITLEQGGHGALRLRITLQQGAASYVVHARPPFTRARATIDVYPLLLDVDPLLLSFALHLYRSSPADRAELACRGQTPRRLVEGRYALESTPADITTKLLTAYHPADTGPLPG